MARILSAPKNYVKLNFQPGAMARRSRGCHDFSVKRKRKPYLKQKPANVRHFIAEWRVYREMTQGDLEEATGISDSNISQIENGKQGYTQETLETLARALGTDPASLLVVNPLDGEAVWSIWDRISEDQKPRARNVLSAFVPPEE